MHHSLSRVATTIVVGLLVVACASAASSAPITTALPNSSPPASGSTSPRPTDLFPSLSPPVPAALPVRGSAYGLGVLMAPGPDGGVYISVPGPDGSVLALLDRDGIPRAGWPITVPGSVSCGQPVSVEDGSVRIVCTLDNPQGNMFGPIGAFAFDSTGSSHAGWPVDLAAHGLVTVRAVGDGLIAHAWTISGDVILEGQPAGDSWIMTADPDATVRNGARAPYGMGCCGPDEWALGPDGVAYGVVHHGAATLARTTSELTAVGPDGVPAGFPIAIEGIASRPAFDAAGRIHVTVGLPIEPPARTLVFDPDGRAVVGRSGELDITATSDWRGAGNVFPAAPLVGADGTTFIIETLAGTSVIGLGPSGQVMPGWPYRSDVGLEDTGFCGPHDTGCGQYRATPTIGPGNVLYLLHAAASPSAGGSIVAIGPDGRVRPGWPVELRQPGAEFWSVTVGSDGTAYVLAIEPESGDTYSAGILAIAPDGTVLSTTTIVDP